MNTTRHNMTTAATQTVRSYRRNRRLKISEHAIGPSIWILILLWLSAWGIGEFIIFVAVPAWRGRGLIELIGPGTLFWFVFVGAGGVAGFITWIDFRTRLLPPVYDETVYPEEFEHEKPIPQPAPPAQREIPVNERGIVRSKVMVNRKTKVLRDGKIAFGFTGKNLDQLAIWLREGHMSIRRTGSSAGPGFNQLPDPITSERYTDASRVLKANGMIDDDNNWTQKGVMWALTN